MAEHADERADEVGKLLSKRGGVMLTKDGKIYHLDKKKKLKGTFIVCFFTI